MNVTVPVAGTYTNTSGNLFIGTLDTGNAATDTLTVNTAPAGPAPVCGLTMAQWTFAGFTTNPPPFPAPNTLAANVTTAAIIVGGTSPGSLTAEEFTAYATRLVEDPARAGFLVCERDSGKPAGFVNVNNIVEGAFRNGALGYGAFAHAARRGLMSEGLALVVRHALGPAMNLHRLEINVQPGNHASIALARRCGFRLEGFSPDFLYIDGAWRDHERWAITVEDWRSA